MALTPDTLTRHELNGLPVRVADAANPDLVGISGRVVVETMRTFHVDDGCRVRQVPKAGSCFEFAITNAEDAQRASVAPAADEAAGAAEADLSSPFPLDGDPDDGVHMLIFDELLYAADRGLVDPDDVVALAESKPDGLELVLTGSHAEPAYLAGVADLITNVRKVAHPFDAGHRARRGTEY
ncbi:MAG: ribonuclease P protein subunit [Halorubrum sp.]